MSDLDGAQGVYDYCDEQGKKLFQVVRFPGKAFRQRHLLPNGKWQWGMGETRRVLYRLPELVANRGKRRVIVVEGEKDVDRLTKLGFLATTNPMGAGKWRDEYGEALRDCHVILIPDNDPVDEKLGYSPGACHMDQVYESLMPYAASIAVLHLDGLPDKGDVSDWLDAGHTKQELIALASSIKPTFVREQHAEAQQEAEQATEASEFRETTSDASEPTESERPEKMTDSLLDGKSDCGRIDSDVMQVARALLNKAERLDAEDWVLVAEGMLRRLKRSKGMIGRAA